METSREGDRPFTAVSAWKILREAKQFCYVSRMTTIPEPTPFFRAVVSAIKKIPRGKVASYGQIAAFAGNPRGSRGVAWILHSSSNKQKLPWHRVINSQGKISFPADSRSFALQKRRLEAEGVEVSPAGAISLREFQWTKRN